MSAAPSRCSRACDTVRIVDGQEVLATHRRSFDRGAQIEDPAHVAGAWSPTSAPRVPIGRRTACTMPPRAPRHCSCAPPSAAPTWACSPAGCCSCSTATAQPRWRRPSPRRSPRMPRIWARCATSSTPTPTPAASARPSPWRCPTIRGCATYACSRNRLSDYDQLAQEPPMTHRPADPHP